MALFRAALLPSPTILHTNHLSFLPPVLVSDEPSPVSLQRSCVYTNCGRQQRWRQRVATDKAEPALPASDAGRKRLRVLIAGGGIGGLVFALAAKNKGFDVKVFEKDMSAIRGEGQYRGPIQIQSNALAALESVDSRVAEEIMEAGCVTGDRINGLVDGISGAWDGGIQCYHCNKFGHVRSDCPDLDDQKDHERKKEKKEEKKKKKKKKKKDKKHKRRKALWSFSDSESCSTSGSSSEEGANLALMAREEDIEDNFCLMAKGREQEDNSSKLAH